MTIFRCGKCGVKFVNYSGICPDCQSDHFDIKNEINDLKNSGVDLDIVLELFSKGFAVGAIALMKSFDDPTGRVDFIKGVIYQKHRELNNQSLAIAHYQKSMELGYEKAKEYLGLKYYDIAFSNLVDIYIVGSPSIALLLETIELLERAYDLGISIVQDDLLACYYAIAGAYKKIDLEKYIEYRIKIINIDREDNETIEEALGAFYNWLGVNYDFSETFEIQIKNEIKFFDMAMKLGNRNARRNLEILYKDLGYENIEKLDSNEGFERAKNYYLELQAFGNEKQKRVTLNHTLYRKVEKMNSEFIITHLDESIVELRRIYELCNDAARRELSKALNFQGLKYELGIGCKTDKRKALRFYNESISVMNREIYCPIAEINRSILFDIQGSPLDTRNGYINIAEEVVDRIGDCINIYDSDLRVKFNKIYFVPFIDYKWNESFVDNLKSAKLKYESALQKGIDYEYVLDVLPLINELLEIVPTNYPGKV